MSGRISRAAMAVLLASALSGPAIAGETKTYTYDALGRLVVVENSGTVNNNETRSFCYDKAGNRIEFDSNSSGTPSTCVEEG